MKSVVEQGFFHEFAFHNKALKTFVEFRSVENVQSSNAVEFELHHISRINATTGNQLNTLHTEIYSKEHS